MKKIFLSFLVLIFFSCKKDKVPAEPIPSVKQWQKFVGNYKVYDTAGSYLYDAQISHFSSINQFGAEVDSILITNFADTMDLEFNFSYNTNEKYFDIRFHDSVVDYNSKSWHVSRIYDDTMTPELENEMRNDSIVLYFKMTNLPYYINESVPYFECNCKHVYVKQ